jgi:hypothetical protein
LPGNSDLESLIFFTRICYKILPRISYKNLPRISCKILPRFFEFS